MTPARWPASPRGPTRRKAAASRGRRNTSRAGRTCKRTWPSPPRSNRLTERAKSAVADQTQRLTILKELAEVAKEFRNKENELFTAVTTRGQTDAVTDKMVFELSGIRNELAPPAGTLKDRKIALDRKIAELGGVDSFFGENANLRAGYERGVKEVKRQTELVKTLLAECEPFAPKKINTDLARQANLVSSN